jgi:hypothetical protein
VVLKPLIGTFLGGYPISVLLVSLRRLIENHDPFQQRYLEVRYRAKRTKEQNKGRWATSDSVMRSNGEMQVRLHSSN